MDTFDKALSAFLLAREANGAARNTLDWYRRMLTPYRVFLARAGRLGEWTSPEAVRLYMVEIGQERIQYKSHPTRPPVRKRLSVATIRARHRALRAFFLWLVEEGHLDKSPMRNVKAPREEKDLPKALDPGDFLAMLDAACKPRDRALLLFLADTGVRDREARELTRDNLDLERGRALVKGKGRKERMVYFGTATADALAQYLASRDDDLPQVFIGKSGALGETAIYQILSRLAKKAGVKGRYNPHSFRHFFASQYVARGGDLETLRQLLGHADIQTTIRYLHFRDDILQRKHDEHSPVSHLVMMPDPRPEPPIEKPSPPPRKRRKRKRKSETENNYTPISVSYIFQ